MSCNGCRVLRKGCSESCILRSCLQWITAPEAQGNATLFLAKFFGRSDLMSLIASVPEPQRPALFQSLLFEACGRTVNPVNGAVGLLWSGNWHVCQAAVETVLSGGNLQPLPAELAGSFAADRDESSESFATEVWWLRNGDRGAPAPKMAAGCSRGGVRGKRGRDTASFCTQESSETTTFDSGIHGNGKKLLNLFV